MKTEKLNNAFWHDHEVIGGVISGLIVSALIFLPLLWIAGAIELPDLHLVGPTQWDWENPPEYLEPGMYQVIPGGEDFELQFDEPLKSHLVGIGAQMKFDHGVTIWKGSNLLEVHPDDAFKWVSIVRSSDNLVIRIQIGMLGAPCGPIDPSCGARG